MANLSRRLSNWWNRPCGGREVLAVAAPMMISYGLWSIMNLIDRMFLMRYSTASFAASLAPGMMQWAAICLPMGIAGYVNTFVAQYSGAGDRAAIGRITWQGVWVSMIAVPMSIALAISAPHLFAAFGHLPESVVLETEYFQSLLYGTTALVLNAALASYFSGQGRTMIVMYANCLSMLMNLVLDYVMIFGKFGFPEWGIYGAGLATSISNWASVAVLFGAMLLDRDAEKNGVFSGFSINRHLIGRLIYFGGPSGLPMMIEAAGISTLVLFISRFGETESAATNLAFNVNGVAFVPMLGIGIAVSTLVGRNLAAGHAELADRAVWTALVLGVGYQLVFAAMYLGVPDAFLMLHSSFADSEEFGRVRSLTLFLLRFVAVYCVFDAAQAILVGALKGAGDTWSVMFISGGVAIASLIVGRYGEFWFGWQVIGWWGVLTGWIFALGVIFFIRFRQGKWKSMRVIEPSVEVIETQSKGVSA